MTAAKNKQIDWENLPQWQKKDAEEFLDELVNGITYKKPQSTGNPMQDARARVMEMARNLKKYDELTRHVNEVMGLYLENPLDGIYQTTSITDKVDELGLRRNDMVTSQARILEEILEATCYLVLTPLKCVARRHFHDPHFREEARYGRKQGNRYSLSRLRKYVNFKPDMIDKLDLQKYASLLYSCARVLLAFKEDTLCNKYEERAEHVIYYEIPAGKDGSK